MAKHAFTCMDVDMDVDIDVQAPEDYTCCKSPSFIHLMMRLIPWLIPAGSWEHPC